MMKGESMSSKLIDILTGYDVDNIFTYHRPKDGQPEIYESLRNMAKAYAELVLLMCPDSRERSLALTKIEESNMWANAAIARRG